MQCGEKFFTYALDFVNFWGLREKMEGVNFVSINVYERRIK